MEARRAQVQSQKAQEQADLAVLKEQFNHLQIQPRGARVQKQRQPNVRSDRKAVGDIDSRLF